MDPGNYGANTFNAILFNFLLFTPLPNNFFFFCFVGIKVLLAIYSGISLFKVDLCIPEVWLLSTFFFFYNFPEELWFWGVG